MKTWFDTHRMDMLNSACTKVLSPQVQGDLSFAEIIQLAGLLESHNNESVRRNTVADLSQHDIEIGSELRQAIVAETVAAFDKKTIGNFTWGAEKEHILDLDNRTDGEKLTPSYVGDRLTEIPEKMKKILDYFPDDGEGFVLCTPLMISILQSAAKATYVPAVEGTFVGPNNTMLVGHADGAPVYSYLQDYTYGQSPNMEEDLIILGNYQKGKDGAVTHRLLVKNLSFA